MASDAKKGNSIVETIKTIVYALLIAAFVPSQSIGFLNLQGLVLFGLYMLGIVGGLMTAFLMRQTALRGPKPSFALMLPAGTLIPIESG